MIQKKQISLVVNGKPVKVAVVPGISLADCLHEYIGLTGTKVTCSIGVCKVCTVAIKKKGSNTLSRAQACVTPVESIDGHEILTVEGVESHPRFKRFQEAFLRNFSFQCGYCAPGFIMGACLLMDELERSPIKKDALDDVILESLGDHICRCTGYVRYYKAIKDVILETPGLVLS